MTATPLIKCGCCANDMIEDGAPVDGDLRAPVCLACQLDLRWAQAVLGRAMSEAYDDVPSMPISIKGCYHGADAGDNR